MAGVLTEGLLLLGLATANASLPPVSFPRTLCALEFGKEQKEQACAMLRDGPSLFSGASPS